MMYYLIWFDTKQSKDNPKLLLPRDFRVCAMRKDRRFFHVTEFQCKCDGANATDEAVRVWGDVIKDVIAAFSPRGERCLIFPTMKHLQLLHR
jgi:hypothetical protein